MKNSHNMNRINAAQKPSKEPIVTELEVVDDMPQVINEMARIGFIKDKIELEVYVNTDDGGELPHFHVRDKATGGGQFHCCIRFDAPMYFPHEGKRSTMNAKQRKALVEFLKSVDRDSGKTLWWESLHEWNRNNSDVTVDLSTPMPDYQHLRMPDASGKRDPMSNLQSDAEPELDSVIIAKLLKDAINELEEEARKRPQPEPPQPSLESLGEKVVFGADETEHLNESEDYTLPAPKVFQWINKELVEARSQGAVKGFDIRPKIDDGDPKSYPILHVACISSLAYNFETVLKERFEFYGWYIGFKKQEPHELRPGVFVLQQEFLVEPNFPVQNDRTGSRCIGIAQTEPGFQKMMNNENKEQTR